MWTNLIAAIWRGVSSGRGIFSSKADARKESDGSEFFVGRQKRTGGALISPELVKWVAEKAARESAILKESQKAAKEQALAHAKK